MWLVAVGSGDARAVTTFLHHFDVGNSLNGGAGTADYAVGNPEQLIGPPNGPGGQIVPAGRFGSALNRASGGRIEYQTADADPLTVDNFDVLKGTIEMWIKGPGVVGTTFKSLWGVDTSSGNGDIRMYIYNDNANDGLRSLGAYQKDAGGAFWEIERAIPEDKLDDVNWHHVVWEYDATPGTEATALWWDGVLLGNTADDGFTINPRTTFNNTRMHIGESQAGSAPWPGLIDEFRISNHLVYDVQTDLVVPTAPFASPAPVVAGDYDNDADVDGHDFLVWERGFGASVPQGVDPDGSGNGLVDAADLSVWESRFGPSGAQASAAAVPEPTAALLAAVAFVASGAAAVRQRPCRRQGD